MTALRKKSWALTEAGGYALAGMFLLAICFSSLIERGNNALLDPLRTNDIVHDAVIIGIDDVTLGQLGAWPLDRKVFAEVIEALEDYEIKGLAFDVLFLEEKPEDVYILKALSDASYPVVLGSKIVSDQMLLPVYPLEGRISSGFVNVFPDADGKVRKFIKSDTRGGVCSNSLALQSASQETYDCFDEKAGSFLYPKVIPEFSLVDLVQGKIPKELLKGKMLFVGATTLDLEDYFIGLSGHKIPGVYVHASMYASHENNLYTKTLDNEVVAVLLVLIMLLGGVTVLCIQRTFLQIVLFGVIVSVVIVGTVILFDKGFEFPLLQALIALIFSFVAVTIARYAHSRRENAFIKSMFSRYVNKDVLQTLLKSKAHLKEGEKRRLSVLFSDLRGFTDFSETLSPEELTRLLNDYFASMVSEIFKENGTVDKFIGDAVMAFWNAPLPLKHHELHAVLAAIGMQNALTRFNDAHGTSLKMGIGIHTGDAVVGNIGGEERVSYTALGDSVNTASRIENITKKYCARIIVSEDIASKVKTKLQGNWRMRKLDCVRLKGKQNSVTLYEITDILPSAISVYEQALSEYQQGNLKEAEQLLQSQELKSDVPATVLIKRIQENIIPEGFDGVWVFDEK